MSIEELFTDNTVLLNRTEYLAEDMVKYIINYALDNAPEEMEFFNRFIDKELFNRLNILSKIYHRTSCRNFTIMNVLRICQYKVNNTLINIII